MSKSQGMAGIGSPSALSQQLGQYTNTAATGQASLQSSYGHVVYPYSPSPVFPNDPVVGGLVGVYRVRKLENGYLVESAPYAGGPVKEHFAETLKDVGERVAALGVQKALGGQTP